MKFNPKKIQIITTCYNFYEYHYNYPLLHLSHNILDCINSCNDILLNWQKSKRARKRVYSSLLFKKVVNKFV